MQEPMFKALNMIVKLTRPAPAITELINGWYAGNSRTQITTFVPTGWSASQNIAKLYTDVVAKSCRTCHVALFKTRVPQTPANSTISWRSYAQFEADYNKIQNTYVCGNRSKPMPHTLITFKNFWKGTAPNRIVDALAGFSDEETNWTPFGSCQ